MQDLSNDQKIKLLRELATIFRSLKDHADKSTYKDDEAGAMKLIIEGLDKGAQAWSLMNKLKNEYGHCNEDPQCMNRSLDVPLSCLEERKVGIAKDEISYHEHILVQEVTGQDGWEFIWHYLALANDLDRWADELEKEKGDKGAIRTEIPQNQYSEKLTQKAAAVYELLKNLPPERGMTGREILNALSKNNIFLDHSSLTKNIIPVLKKHYKVKNKRGVGYFIA